MRNLSIVRKVSAVAVLLATLSGFAAANAQSGPAASSVTSSDGCAAHTIGAVGGSSAVYYAPNPNDIIIGTIIYPGSSFYVCTAVTVPGWTAFEITVPGTVLYVPAGIFPAFSSPALTTGSVPAFVPTQLPTQVSPSSGIDSLTGLPILTSSLEPGGALPVGSGTFGTCATFQWRPVVSTSAVYYAARPDAIVENLTINAGSQFAVCTDSNINGWTQFQITIPRYAAVRPIGNLWLIVS